MHCPCTNPCTEPCTAQLARQPQPHFNPSGTIRTETTWYCCLSVVRWVGNLVNFLTSKISVSLPKCKLRKERWRCNLILWNSTVKCVKVSFSKVYSVFLGTVSNRCQVESSTTYNVRLGVRSTEILNPTCFDNNIDNFFDFWLLRIIVYYIHSLPNLTGKWSYGLHLLTWQGPC